MNRSAIIILITSLLFIVLAFLFRENLSQFKSLGLLGIFLINLIGSATLFFPAPAIASVVAGGAIYPPVLVALVAAFGAAVGDMSGFLVGLSGKHLFIKNHHTWYKILKDLFHKSGFLVIFLFALIPNPFFDFVGISAGLFHFPPARFFLFMFLGRLARNIMLAFVGSFL